VRDRPINILLSGTVGSHAYGLNTPDSDVDTLGVFAEPAGNFWKLSDPKDTYVETDPNPDLTLHEARKYARLALQCNPTALELMWIPDELIQVNTPHGQYLQAIRHHFLSARRIRDAYLGYAVQQFKRLKDRQDGTFSSDTRNRTAKHARHMMRLMIQGVELHQEGTLTLHLEDPEGVRAFGKAVADGDTLLAETSLEWARTLFDTPSVLPEEPRTDIVEDWLGSVRREYS
jgi:uncharacterized protein